MRVLLVEDDRMVARAAMRTLATLGHEATWSATSGEALDAIESGAFDVVICDERLGDAESGALVLEHAREMLPNALRVLASGNDVQVLVREASNLGTVQYFIQKPYTSAELGDLERRVLSGRTTIPARRARR